ncbi:uncharacterized protein [Epargyreus clarus]|uniref:uncharacterized protein isoform X2 n=1 Tax=Epargyreus clarus TaxID=520877 RepID=UPI003C300CA1
MACVEIPAPVHGDSEMEEGEIVDEVDELSDISSEEEFLLRQRLQVLENYNNVLERKQAKRTSKAPIQLNTGGKRSRREEVVLCDLSEISETDLEDNNIHVSHNFVKKAKLVKPHKRKKQTKQPETVLRKIKDCKKKTKQNKKKSTNKVYIKSSDESDEEYLNKRKRLANAVTLKKNKNDTSTLKERINRMLFGPRKPSNIIEIKTSNTLADRLGIYNKLPIGTTQQDNYCDISHAKPVIEIHSKDTSQSDALETKLDDIKSDNNVKIKEKNASEEPNMISLKQTINLCTDNESSQDIVDSVVSEKEVDTKEAINENKSEGSSDEDLEQLREYALKTKSAKSKTETSNEVTTTTTATENKLSMASDDEDSDTAELRLICLKSTLLKKAIEMKRKQKLRKRLSQSTCLQDDLMIIDNMNIQSENNTDIESVDMDIGSDGEEKAKENSNTMKLDSNVNEKTSQNGNRQEDELDEDEDLLRAKLLTSLSKNLPNLVNLTLFTPTNEENKSTEKDNEKNTSVSVPEEKKFIIKLGESDSEGEHEATKNLTKMHMKLAEHYQDFQSKLDTLLKSTRMEFEKDTSPDVAQKPVLQKPAEKFVPKAMNHLPKSEQIEYKNLVKRMAELEKIKQARHSLLTAQNKPSGKDTLKPRNVSLNSLKATNDIEEKIALSRKKIAEESAKVLKLKEEAKKLTQKYKKVSTELRNISTAINLNKRQQRAVHTNLQQIRLQHQLLLKGSLNVNTINSNRVLSNKIQKENNPTPEETTYTNLLKSVKVSFVNDVNKNISTVESRLSVQLDVTNNKKTIKLPKSPPKGRIVDIVPNTENIGTKTSEREIDTCHPLVEKGGGLRTEADMNTHISRTIDNSNETSVDDYKSPLDAFGNTTWAEDPNAFLCPYEVGGSCRDPDCKYLHPKIPSHH